MDEGISEEEEIPDPCMSCKAWAEWLQRSAAFSPRRLLAYAWREMLEIRRYPVRLAFALLGTAFSMGYSHSILRWAKRPSSSSSFLLNPLYGACTKTVLTELLANRLNLPGRYSLDIHLG